MISDSFIGEILDAYRDQKLLPERAAAQVSDAEFFATTRAGTPSIAIVMKHVGGNLRSRWRDFLTTDGEKADRHRDREFETEGLSRAEIEAMWNEGWRIALETLASLEPADLERRVTIRGEPHGVVRAILRNLAHSAYHAGQIIQLARHFKGDQWQSLSVPLGQSEAHNASMRARFGDWLTEPEQRSR